MIDSNGRKTQTHQEYCQSFPNVSRYYSKTKSEGSGPCLKELRQLRFARIFKFVVCNPCQFSSSSTILVSLWFIIISLVFFHLSKLLFSGFLQFKGKLLLSASSCSDSFKLFVLTKTTLPKSLLIILTIRG